MNIPWYEKEMSWGNSERRSMGVGTEGQGGVETPHPIPSYDNSTPNGADFVGFHLRLLVFPFIYQFNSRIGVLVKSSFANELVQKDFNNISASFQNLFVVIFKWERM